MNTAIPEPSSGYVAVGDLRMYHDALGEGRPLLLLHGGIMHDRRLASASLRPRACAAPAHDRRSSNRDMAAPPTSTGR